MIKWNCTREETEIAVEIAKRAIQKAQEVGINIVQGDMIMDIEACHCNGTPLKLKELLDAPDNDFAHDVWGIRSNIDRTTGKLTGGFLPRYAK